MDRRRFVLTSLAGTLDAPLGAAPQCQFHLLGRPDPKVVTTPPVLMAFDCLRVLGVDIHGLPLRTSIDIGGCPGADTLRKGANAWCASRRVT